MSLPFSPPDPRKDKPPEIPKEEPPEKAPKGQDVADKLPSEPLTLQEKYELRKWAKDNYVDIYGRIPIGYKGDLPAGFSFVPGRGLAAIPNYEKLSWRERWVMDRLTTFGNTKTGKKMTEWNEGWLGTALSVIDVLAEGLERGTGLLTQWVATLGDPEHNAEFWSNIGEAWYAGSLTADMANLPRHEGGKLVIPSELPGLEGLVGARQKIAALTDQGMSLSDALVQTREELYSSEGALAFRMMLHDAFFHIAADPLNVLMPYLRPIERLKVATIKKLSVAGLPDDIAETVAQLSRSLEQAREAGAPAERIAEIESALAKVQKTTALTPRQTAALKLMGEIPVTAEGGGWIDKIMASRWNPLGLTPEAKAAHLGELVTDGILTRIVANSPDDPEQIMRALKRLSDATLGPEYGHMVATVEGRMVRGVAQLATGKVESAMNLYRGIAPQRELLNTIGEMLGQDAHYILKRLLDGEEAAVYAQFMEKMAGLPDDIAEAMGIRYAEVLAALGKSPDAFDAVALGRLATELGEGAVLTTDAMRAVMVSLVVEAGAQAAVVKFGVKSRGFLQKMAHMVKSAENLMFLRTNPGYAIRNFINGEFTMLGRGTYGLFSHDMITDFWGKMKFQPARLYAGHGPAGIAGELAGEGGKAYRASQEIIAKAARGEVTKMDDIARAINNINLGKADMGKLAGEIEGWQRARAFTKGAMKYKARYAPQTVPKIADVSPTLARELGDEAGAIERAVASAVGPDDLDDLFDAPLQVSPQGIIEEGGRKFGGDIYDVLPADEAGRAAQRLADAAKTGNAQNVVDELVMINKQIMHKIDAHRTEQAVDLAVQAAIRAEHDPGAVPAMVGDMFDDFYGAHHRGFMDMSEAAEAARQADFETADRIWRGAFNASDAHYDAVFDRLEKQMGALERGLNEAGQGQKYPFIGEIKQNFKNWRKGWKGFFKKRNKLMSEFFDAKLKGKKYKKTFDQIMDELDIEYAKMIDIEDDITRRTDDAIVRMVPDDKKPVFRAWRESVAQLRRADKEALAEFRKSIRDLPAEARAAEWHAEIQARMQRIANIEMAEQLGLKAMQGDETATAMLQTKVVVNETLDSARNKLLRGHGAALTQEEMAALEYARSIMPESTFLREARKEFGEFSDTAVKNKMDEWAAQLEAGGPAVADPMNELSPANLLEQEVGAAQVGAQKLREELFGEPDNIHSLLRKWADEDGDYKKLIIDYIKENPEEAAEVQRFAQWWLKENGIDNVQLTPKGMVRITRGTKKPVPLDQIDLRAFDSYSSNPAVGNLYSRGPVLEFDVPSENIFTHFEAHPALRGQYIPDAEFILNEKGVSGARLVSIDGRPPTPDEIAILKNKYPSLVVDTPFDAPGLPDFHEVVPRIMPDSVGIEQLYRTRGQPALNAMGEAAIDAAKKPPLKYSNLSEAGQSAMRNYVDEARGWMADSNYQATRFGAYTADSALLNYNRRFNYNTWLGTLFPYEFWTTQSIFKWALHSIDRPAMASTALRTQRFLDTAYRPSDGGPSRLKGHIKIPVPFLPDWMGNDIYIDPLRTALPFKNWANMENALKSQESSDNYATMNVLEQMLSDGMIGEGEYAEAMNSRSGPAWERAVALARMDDTEGRLSGFDLANTLTSAHAPLVWAYNAARGTPEEIGPFLPITRSVKGITALLGIGPAGGWNPEAAIRRELGLPAFDKWDEYRTDRMLANMVAMGEISAGDANRAMIEREGPIFEEAKRKAGIEYGITALGSSTGLPMKAYPEGEQRLRALKDDYEHAWSQYEAGDLDALNDFYEQNPGYETRKLALKKGPEEQLKYFLVDEMWNIWHDLPKVHKDEIKEHLGERFGSLFLSKETRSTESLSNNELAYFLKVMGGDPPGQFKYEGTQTPLELTDPYIARQVQTFYDTREAKYKYSEVIWPLQQDYFSLKPGAPRRKFKLENPIYQSYLNWRKDFMLRNPDTIPYIEDNPKYQPKFPSIEALRSAQQGQPNYTTEEWRAILGEEMWRLIQDVALGDELPPVAKRRLEQLGYGEEQLR